MKFFSNFFKSLFSLGIFGLVILVMIGLLLLASRNIESESFELIQDRIDLLNALEDNINSQINLMQLHEAYTIFTYVYGTEEDEDTVQVAQDADADITNELAKLESEGFFDEDQPYAEDIAETLDEFNNLRATHRETFEQTLAAYEAEDMDEASTLLEQLQDEDESINDSYIILIQYVERGRLDAMNEFPEGANRQVKTVAISLLCLLVLSLFGYTQVAAATSPLHSLRNAITAIGGDQYRPELLEGLLKQGGRAGKLARALDKLAQEQHAQNADLKADVERLRQELYESPRRRLKLYRETEPGSENQ
jgi:hypothetical protein